MVPEEFPERRLLEMTFFPFLHHRLHERANLCIQNGTEGVVELTQWFERMETVFRISNCSVENQIKFSTCTLLAGALTWWNSQLDLFGSGCWVQPTYPGTSTVILPLLCVRMFPEESGQAVLLLDGLHLDDKLHFVEEPLEIVGREVKWLKRSRIPLVKVRWNSMRGLSLLEREDQFKKKYPHLFTKTASSSSAASNDAVVRNMPKPGSKTCIPNVQFNDMLSKFVTANTASTSGHDAFLANNGSTEDVQPPVVQVQTRNPNPEPNVAPVVTPVPKASIPFPSRRNDERRKEKELPPHLEYAFLEGDDKLPVIIAKDLKDEEKAALLKVLKSHKRAIAWKLSDIKGVSPEFCTHKILMEEDYEPSVQSQRRPLGEPEKMLKRCEDTNLSLNWEKSHFMVREGIVLGHKISKSGLEVDRAKVEVIAKLPHPTSVKGDKTFVFLGQEALYILKAFATVDSTGGHFGANTQQEKSSIQDSIGPHLTKMLWTLSPVVDIVKSGKITQRDEMPQTHPSLFAKSLTILGIDFWPFRLQDGNITYSCAVDYFLQRSCLSTGVTHSLSPGITTKGGQVEVSNRGLKRFSSETWEKMLSWISPDCEDSLAL
ncbi:hypothetical protein Tco_1540648 [Tanacetum coccineum]